MADPSRRVRLLRHCYRRQTRGADDLLARHKDVLTVDAETSAAEAAGLLNNNKFGSLPVTKNEKLVGIVTAGDFMRIALRYLDRELREL
jgi:CBS domain-containing protein